ncbi:hydroquinone glucosyltransferase-like [Neltuma alba]|uniref:hydroquinone glucosyltransferase n=1 Tax=Neltuma alba TaxID=207710 RepID=UPI0010A38B4C|nr:hydroquinone glucosyltransferase-like [Prosopis alba]XP_028787927.1 hydroquinone glucosyltransferase-like [Prosopis alba]
MERKSSCIAMVPAPGFSHLLPLIEFSKRLAVHQPHFHITFFIPTLGPPSPATISIFESIPPQIDFTILPQINTEDLKAQDTETQIYNTVTLSLPSLRHALSSFYSATHHLVAMVVDYFSMEAIDIAKELKVKSYLLFPCSTTLLCFCLHFPELDEDHEMVPTGFRDLSQPLKLPGCISFQGRDLMDPVQERSSGAYKTILHACKKYCLLDGILVNSFVDLEQGVVTALQESNQNHPLVYHVGPIIQTRMTNINESNSECLTWLGHQPRNSVLYISFGSGGTLSKDQLDELAWGLEMSGHKFLWVLRAPSGVANSGYLSAQRDDPLSYLPKGFLEKTNGQGFVVPSWAPQIEVLKHESTGGFLTHCGWNSTLEAMVYGKPMIVWPLFAEQRMNAVMLTEQFKVAVRPKGDENKNGIVMREEAARVVKIVMEDDEGRELRRRIQVFKDSAAKALSEDGSCARTMSTLAQEWTNLSSK